MPRLEMVDQLLAQGEVNGPDTYPQKIRQHFREDWDDENPDESTSAITPEELAEFRQFVEDYGF
jgi:hypothetical protein